MVMPFCTEPSVVSRLLTAWQVPGEKEGILQKLYSNHAVWSDWSFHFFCNYFNRYEFQLLRRPFKLRDSYRTSNFKMDS